MAYLGVFQIAGAYLLVVKGLRQVTALETSLLLLAETALNPLWSWLVLREVPARLALAGGALIIAATVAQAVRAPARPHIVRGRMKRTLFETVRMIDGRAPLWSLHMDRLSRSCIALEVTRPDLIEPRGGARSGHPVRDPDWRRPDHPASVREHRIDCTSASRRHRIGDTSTRRPIVPGSTRPASAALLAGADDALFLTEGGLLVEGTRWAVGWWEGEALCFPPLSLGGLPSVARARLGEFARGGIQLAEIGMPAIRNRTLLACNAARGVVPVFAARSRAHDAGSPHLGPAVPILETPLRLTLPVPSGILGPDRSVVPVAQLVRAPHCGCGGCGFNPRQAP